MKNIIIFLFLITANFLFAVESGKKDEKGHREEIHGHVSQPTMVTDVAVQHRPEEKKYNSFIFKFENNKSNLSGVEYFIKDETLNIPSDFKAADVENDGGGVIELSWSYLTKEQPESFDILRKSSKEKTFTKVKTIKVSSNSYIYQDKTAKINDKYKYTAVLNGEEVTAKATDFKWGKINVTWNSKVKTFPSEFKIFRKKIIKKDKVKGKNTKKDESIGKEIGTLNTAINARYQYRDDKKIDDDLTYTYKIIVKKDGRFNETKEKTAKSEVAIFDAHKTSVLIAAIFLTFAIVFFIKMARSGKKLYIRRIAGLDAVDDAVGRATEMGREIMFVPGIGDIDDPQTIAGLTILGRVAKLTAQYKTPLSVPVSRSMVMVTGREIVKESYLSMGRPENFQNGMVYYLTDDQFGFAAGVDGIMVREKPATIFLQGSFFAESLILAETGHHVGAIQISGTAAPSQLPFFITACDYTLMGEELYAASAYLSREPQLLGSLRGQDAGKAIILFAIIVGIILETIAAVNPDLQWLSIKHYFHIK